MNRGHLRLLHLREQTEAIAETMIGERARFATLRKDSARPRAVSAFNLFQTPQALAERMASMVRGRTLEPSAGLGRLYQAFRNQHAEPMVLVENAPQCCRELYAAIEGDQGATLLQRDFLTYHPGPVFDSVLMNPPFKRGTDVKHILHARKMLRPGGLLVAMCFDGSTQGHKLQPIADTWEPLGPDVFKSEGTRAGVVLLTLTD